jgi:hypothetical protein
MIGAIQLGSDIDQVHCVLRQLNGPLRNRLSLVEDIGAQNTKKY